MEMTLWNIVLTAFLGVLGWSLREKSEEINRLQILLNRTREEIAKEYVTKSDVHNDINRILDRIDRLEMKIDTFIREQKSALS
jgi:predicted DNA-binding protein YlxM (UPF0122 family)